MMGSAGFSQASASETEINFGSLRAGIPSLGGPPERISLYRTLCLLKSVLNSDVAPAGGGSSGDSVGVTEFLGDKGTSVGTGLLIIGAQALKNSIMASANS